MKKLIILISLVFVTACSDGTGGSDDNDYIWEKCSNPDKSHITDFGYYHVNTADAYGNFTNDVADHSTFAHVYPCKSKIEPVVNNGMRVVIDMHRILWKEKWKEALEDFVFMIQPYVNAGEVLAFYVSDEPYWNGKTYTQLNDWCKALKYYFPDVELWVTFAYPSVNDNLRIPETLDKVSITPDYGNYTVHDMAYMVKLIKKKMYKHQSIVLTFDGFSFGGIPPEYIQEYKADTMYDYFMLAKCDKRITALWVFLYPSYSQGTGINDMPIVKDSAKDIGYQIF